MSNYAIYFSPTGGTKRVSDIIRRELGCDREIDLTKADVDYGKFAFEAGDVCLFAVPSYGGRVPGAAVQRIAQMSGKGAKAVLLAVFGNRAIDDTLLELKDVLLKAGFSCAAAVEAVAEHSIMHQYGKGRPDAVDAAELQGFAKSIAQRLKDEEPGDLQVPGNRPYREYNGVPLKPSVSAKCTLCGTCALLCPVGAINAETPNETDTSLCVSCMRCVSACPNHARRLNPLVLKTASLGLKKACQDRKPNKLYI